MKHRSVVVLCATLLLLAPAVAGAQEVLSATFDGTPTYVKGNLGRIDLGGDESLVRDSATDALMSILTTHFNAVGDEEMDLIRTHTDKAGNVHLRFQETYNGLPVVGSQMVLHVDKTGLVYAVNGEFAAGRDLPFSPSLDAEKALENAIFEAGIKGGQRFDEPSLTYVHNDAKTYLAWQLTLDYVNADGPQRDVVFADAVTGKLVARHPKFYYARSLRTFNCNNGTSCTNLVSSSSNPINTGDNAIDSAHNYAIATYDFYNNNYGRDSIDDNGMILRSRVHYSNNYNNAFWDGTQMTYGDGDGSTFVPLSQDADVVAHELTHGVTEDESGLIYANESGALNEAWSDIFGAGVDRQEGASITDTWLLGEDIYTPGIPGDALRVMDDPAAAGDRDYYPDRYTGSADNGGVHTNSGIANLAFALLVEGGTHPRGKTSNNVPALNGNFDTSLGMALDIFYDANVGCLTPSSNFQAARNCTAAAAQSQFGATAEAAVQEAWDAVGVPGGGGPPPGGGCSGTNVWTGTASSSVQNLVTPNCSASGAFSGVLSCDNGAADLDLYLEKQSCGGWFGCSFGNVAASTSAQCDESISYSGTSGTYRWRINWWSGPAEPFHLCTNKC
jgi:vibriolysin